jgi:hypothetical protein
MKLRVTKIPSFSSMQRAAMTFFIHEAKGLPNHWGAMRAEGWTLLLPTRSLMKPEGSKGTYALVTRDLKANESVQILPTNTKEKVLSKGLEEQSCKALVIANNVLRDFWELVGRYY